MIGPAEIAAALGLPTPTAEQAAVIAAPTTPALVVAGAGAGKTETMAARVVWLVANGLATPERVLGLTFTRKAARQLAERVRARLRRLAGSSLAGSLMTGQADVLAGEPTILTYHAYAGRIVAEHGLRLPVEPGARLLTETAAWQVAHQVVARWAEDLDTDRVPATVTADVLALAGELAEHLVSQDTLGGHAEWLCRLIESAPRAKRQTERLSQDTQRILAAQRYRLALLPLLDSYAQAKRRLGVLDFADQMSLAATLAVTHDEVAAGERDRYGAVLLDEYQDTGHAQRVLLRALFGAGQRLPVTSVGDPAQAIYGWRGASAANLPRFATDFPGEDGPARRFGLLTSFRNPPEILSLANAVAAPLREAGLDVDDLRSRTGAPAGDVRIALLADIRVERDWLADAVAQRWHDQQQREGRPPTTAVLVRRRADMADLAQALRVRGLPVEVVGLGGLLTEPEVRDLVSVLRLLVDPLAGTAAMRLLTGARWRLGAADLAALWRRANELTGGAPTSPNEHAEQAGLADALDDPGDPRRYSADGHRRIRALGAELAGLRRRLDVPLPELVADVERALLLDIEVMARPGAIGRAHLDAFADVVTDFATASPSATLPSLLDYLAVAERAEDGLEPGEVEVAEDRVQVLTVHAAKGLEWQVVAVPHLAKAVFPGTAKTSCWLRTATELPASLRGDAEDLPVLRVQDDWDRREIERAMAEHAEEFEDRRLAEERRLLYVALTRSERSLLVSGHWWGESGGKPRGPSRLFTEVHAAIEAQPDIGVIEHWADEPTGGNPLTENARSVQWPADPLPGRRDAVAEGARLVLAALESPPADLDPEEDPDGWARDVDVLLAERAAAGRRVEQVRLPEHLTVSQLVELADDPDGLARRLRRPLPFPPNPVTRRGTAFHAWLEQRFAAGRLLDVDELPGAADEGAAPDDQLPALREAFLASDWSRRQPHDVEVPFETEIAGVTVRGRMDAVFADPDGGWTVVDWKTGKLPDDGKLPALAVQLAAYRLAWAALAGCEVSAVRAAFHYVAPDRTLRPTDLLDADGLRALISAVPVA
ncbi:MAG TPA: UvrD-helicase domain-containing protein [Pseudonocardiaceae bacterium]|nr:UvrD-helicase domain-containing protein [Pseudonocardiaceae bacterium]